MLFLYRLSLKFYFYLLLFFSVFNEKARLWIDGRKKLLKKVEALHISGPSIWFHFASLGEFEQGRPVLEKVRKYYPSKKIVITFFSPSGYEVRKNYTGADHIFYLPLDTPRNASKFIDLINPEFAVFTKYEYWYYYFNELHKRRIPLYLISAIFHKEQSLFRWYGVLKRKMLFLVTHFFVQDPPSKIFLEELKLNNATMSGDTRFDRVFENSQAPKKIELIEQFLGSSKTLVAGSTWAPDEKVLREVYSDYVGWKLVIAPHEIGLDRIRSIESLFGDREVIKFSDAKNTTDLSGYKILIIDNIGMLSSLYQYADIAYIGGGFGSGIHNTLEAAAFGAPIIFGPRYQKFREAKELIRIGAAFSVVNASQLRQTMTKLMDETYRKECAFLAEDYVKEHTGATSIIVNHITGRQHSEFHS